MSIDKISIAARLRSARKVAGYKTSKEFCQKFDIPESSYSTHENGHRGIKEQLLKQYAEYLNFNYKWLASGQGDPFSYENFSPEQQNTLNFEISQAQKKLQQSPLDKNLLENILEIFFMLLEENNLSATPEVISNIINLQALFVCYMPCVKYIRIINNIIRIFT